MNLVNVKAVERNIYHYDIAKCGYKILKNLRWDMTNIPSDDKLTRNIMIGLLQRDNPKLAKYLSRCIASILDFYLLRNQIKKEDIVLRQKDGIFLKKKLEIHNDSLLSLDFKYLASTMIFGERVSQYLALTSTNKIILKGVNNRPLDLSFFHRFLYFNYGNKNQLANQLENFRYEFFKGTNIMCYTNFNKSKQIYLVPILKYGIMKFSNSSVLKSLDIQDIDKNQIWDKTIFPFIRSLLIYCQ